VLCRNYGFKNSAPAIRLLRRRTILVRVGLRFLLSRRLRLNALLSGLLLSVLLGCLLLRPLLRLLLDT